MTQTRSVVQWHRALLLILDAALLAVAFIIAMWLRFEGHIPPVWWRFFTLSVLWIAPALLVFGFIFGLYNRVWEFARSEAAFAITFAVTGGVGFGSAGIFYSQPVNHSRSVLLMTWVLTILLIGASRFGWRQMRRTLHLDGNNGRGERIPALVYGAGQTGASFVHHLERSPAPPYRVLGFVDDDQSLNRMIVAGYRVLGRGSDLPALVEKLNAEEVILAAPSASGERIRRMLDHVRAAGARARTLPRLLETNDGSSALKDVRDVRYEDLLGRDMADVDLMLDPDYVGGRTILVTGAGGSIGSEICRQLCRYELREIVLLGRGENRIHSIYRELMVAFPNIKLTPCICNFTNAEHVREVFAQHRPQVVFHAGAHKHVYLMEDHPAEAVRNNVVGTANVAQAAAQAGVERFVAISTDKAVEPCNVMGATKRLSELLLLGLDRESETKFSIVRFGNVIGSSGSVLTIFQRQAQEGLPLTVTHREATRFFMTVEEAAFLVLQAGALGEGGDVYVLEMGQPVCIYQMAREFLQLNGRDPDEPGAIVVTSLSHGEKLHERLCSSREDINPTRCSRVLRVSMRTEPELSLAPAELLARAQRAARDARLAEDLLHQVYEAPPVSAPPLVLMTGQ
ncbi:MAG TPA: polysaccharide biosynthesis protein [Armatimonadetes bacterium]|nr:polysaccharide biosynthesis protein [Armatimonadota bacterium]